jgi:tetratricopeptide (TPR) repeat protein
VVYTLRASLRIVNHGSVVGASTLPEPDLEPVTSTADEHPGQAPLLLPLPGRIDGRYAVEAELGRGGMAVVYRVRDTVRDEQLALKRLVLAGPEHRAQSMVGAFEREFHTLVQLAHPRIIEVYDFGSEDGDPYYTMELLDGGDLRERAPLPWRDACAIAHDVCSSLALLHARRLVHRDVSPRNVRSTRGGAAKLIDFGALAPMGPGGQIIGTPPFVAPEVLHRSTLDGRTDLFSLGATLYYALTRRFCYPARDFASLLTIWATRPAPPSSFAPGVPAALDALVMSLVSLDPATRPRSAFEVMQRLSAIAELDYEAADVSQSYLAAPTMVGRDAILGDLSTSLRKAIVGRGGALLVGAAAGLGRTRVLDACALDAKIAGAVVLRVNGGSDGGAPLAAGISLAAQAALGAPIQALSSARRLGLDVVLFDNAPQRGPGDGAKPLRLTLKKLVGPDVDQSALQPKLTSWLLHLAETQPLAVLIDDLHEVDDASLSLIASLAIAAPRRRLFLLATLRTGEHPAAADAFAAIQRACGRLELSVLGRDDLDALVGSMFGDVPNLALLCDRLYQAAAGNVRETLEIAQTLVARGVLRYEGGHWLLPESLAQDDLPSSAAELCRARVADLSPLARELAEVHALASHPSFSRQDYTRVASGVPAARVDEAISELVSSGLLTGDNQSYALARPEWTAVLEAGLDDDARVERHARLADLYAVSPERVIEEVRHCLAGGRRSRAIDLLVPQLESTTSSVGVLALTSMSALKVAEVLDSALDAALSLGRKPKEIHEIRRGVFAIAVVTDEARYYHVADALLAQLKRDSGLTMYESIADESDPMQRLMRALTHAKTVYDSASEDERVLSPEAAIRGVAYYTAISIAIGSRAQDQALIASLPGLLEPFALLSPLLHAMWQNAIATRETVCDNRAEHARKRWLEVDAKLATVTNAEMNYVQALRNAIAFGIGLVEARFGMRTAEARAKALDDDPMQRASAMSLRRVVRLHKGDLAGAESYRKQAELIALHANQRQMFTITLVAELIAHANAGDLAGIRESGQAIEAQAAVFSGWRAYHYLAQGYFELARNNFEAALAAFEQGLALAIPDPSDASRSTSAWLRLEAARIEALLGLDRAEEARTTGRAVLESCAAYGIDAPAFPVRRGLALAAAKLGDFTQACAQLERLIEDLKTLDIEGLELGAIYEARTRVAIWMSDRESAEQYGRLTAQEYRYGQGSPLGARYERLWDEARVAGVTALPALTEIKSSLMTSHQPTMDWTLDKRSLHGSLAPGPRAESALRTVCESTGARAGHLYLRKTSGYELIASCGEGSPDPAVPALIAERVATHSRNEDDATMIEPVEPSTGLLSLTANGTTYSAQHLPAPAGTQPGTLLLDSATRAATDVELKDLLKALS